MSRYISNSHVCEIHEKFRVRCLPFSADSTILYLYPRYEVPMDIRGYSQSIRRVRTKNGLAPASWQRYSLARVGRFGEVLRLRSSAWGRPLKASSRRTGSKLAWLVGRFAGLRDFPYTLFGGLASNAAPRRYNLRIVTDIAIVGPRTLVTAGA